MILRLNDPIFYSLAALSVAAMVAPQLIITYSRWQSLADNVLENGVLIEEDRLASMAAGQGVAFEMVRDSRGRLVARVTADRALGDPTLITSAGVFDALQVFELETLAGYTLRVTFTVSPSEGSGASATYLGAFQRGIGQSAWTEFALEGGPQEIELTLHPPHCSPGYAFFGVWPAAANGANSVDLHSIRVEAVEPYACSGE